VSFENFELAIRDAAKLYVPNNIRFT